MPAPNTSAPIAPAIRAWLTTNPGPHRPRAIAAGLGIPEGMTKQQWTQKVANEVARLWRSGELTKTQTRVPDWKVPLTTYALAQQPDRPANQ